MNKKSGRLSAQRIEIQDFSRGQAVLVSIPPMRDYSTGELRNEALVE